MFTCFRDTAKTPPRPPADITNLITVGNSVIIYLH